MAAGGSFVTALSPVCEHSPLPAAADRSARGAGDDDDATPPTLDALNEQSPPLSKAHCARFPTLIISHSIIVA